MKNTTRMLADEVYEGVNDNGNKVTIDMRAATEQKAQSPVELLLSSLAACAAVDIVLILKKRRKTILDFVIETEGKRRDESPKFFTNIHCHFIITSPDVNEEELLKATKLSIGNYCSVAGSLKAEITFSVAILKP